MKLPSALTTLRPADRWLIGFAGACMLLLTTEMLWPHRLEAGASGEPIALPELLPASFWRPGTIADYQPIVDRPLFTVDRRPFVSPREEVAPVPQQTGPSVQFELTAIITSAAARMALLKTNLAPNVRKISVDQTIDGWTLVEVRENAIVLRNGAEVRVVELQAERARAQRGVQQPTDQLARGQ